jgi:hypothetical protein
MTEEKKDFKEANAKAVVEPGIFEWIITELVDAARNYGTAFQSLEQRRLELKLDGGRSAWVHVKTESNDFLFVSHEQGRLNVNADGQLFMNKEQTIVVGWSNYIGISEVMEAVEKLDTEMAACGRFSPDTGLRTPPTEELVVQIETEKIRVDEMFNPPWARANVTLAAEMSDEDIKNLFDRPEEIDVISHDGMLAQLGTVRGKAMRTEAEQAILAKFGYVREFLPLLTLPVITALNEAIKLYLEDKLK